MADATNRLLNLIKKTNIDTKSNLVSLTVKSVNPLQMTMGDRLVLTKEFIVFDSYIITSRISVGDKFKAISLNDDQKYYIVDIISSAQELDKYIIDGGHGTHDYTALINKPRINGVTLTGNKTTDQLGISIPTKTSDLINDSNFITEELDPNVDRLNNNDILRIFTLNL